MEIPKAALGGIFMTKSPHGSEQENEAGCEKAQNADRQVVDQAVCHQKVGGMKDLCHASYDNNHRWMEDINPSGEKGKVFSRLRVPGHEQGI